MIYISVNLEVSCERQKVFVQLYPLSDQKRSEITKRSTTM